MSKAKKLVLDDITKKKMSGLFPANNSYTVNITPSIYDAVDEGLRPVFVMKPLSNGEMKELSKAYNSGDDINEEEVLKILITHIEDIKNLTDISTGEIITYTSDMFDIIPSVVQAALVQELMNISGLKTN
jgi:hypothetical protein